MRPSLPLLVLVGALTSLAAACTPSCPDPAMAGPATATWSATRTVPSPAGGTSTESTVVVRWSAGPGDRLPGAYYARARFGGLARGLDAGSLVERVEVTGPQELAITLRDLGAYLKTSTHLELFVELPDPRDVVRCAHPGGPDSFAYPLTLDFDPPAHAVSARFEPVLVHRGACSTAPGPVHGGARAGLVLLLVSAGVLAWRRVSAEAGRGRGWPRRARTSR